MPTTTLNVGLRKTFKGNKMNNKWGYECAYKNYGI